MKSVKIFSTKEVVDLCKRMGIKVESVTEESFEADAEVDLLRGHYIQVCGLESGGGLTLSFEMTGDMFKMIDCADLVALAKELEKRKLFLK